MSVSFKNRHRFRNSFGNISTSLEMPHLLNLQTESYQQFLQPDVPPTERKRQGLEQVFQSIFPIKDVSETCILDYRHYTLGKPKYHAKQSRTRSVSYSAPLRVTLRLITMDKNNAGVIQDIKEQELYFGDIPLMTDTGSFIINGTERVIVSQMHKSPGIFFAQEKLQAGSTKLAYTARIIPQRGSWIDFQYDSKEIFARIDRRRKFPATVLLRAMGYEEPELLRRFYEIDEIFLQDAHGLPKEEQKFFKKLNPKTLLGQRASADITSPDGSTVYVREGRKITNKALSQMQSNQLERVPAQYNDIINLYTLRDIFDTEGKVIVKGNTQIGEEGLENLLEAEVKTIEVLYINPKIGPAMRDTLASDKIGSIDIALLDLYKKLKPGDLPTIEASKKHLETLFFDDSRYNLSRVGRMKLNDKLGLKYDLSDTVLHHDDIFATLHYLMSLNDSGIIDDIDHLGNRRVRSVGELLENQCRIGLAQMQRTVKERMSLQENEIMLSNLINGKPLSAALHDFFSGSQLSQFMDQTNPLSEITHKRRLSALGPGGLTRERAGFDVRDVHASHYGRICPIETPEGPNIGLIASLATYARVNPLGFIETPYRKVIEGTISDESPEYLTATQEDQHFTAQANAPIDEERNLVNQMVSSRKAGSYSMIPKNQVEYIDTVPCQLVSVAASLIPFLEHDDANRALMGSNMQRQGVPLVRTEAPLVGTGIEYKVATDSGSCVVAKRAGVVESVDSSRVVVRVDFDKKSRDESYEFSDLVDIYYLTKFARSNQNTCINQRPIIKQGDYVKVGDVIADGQSSEQGELALGQNVLIAFMPWNGFNFEDSIMVSERLVHEDYYTSVHIEVHDADARDTKLGREEITCDIPNVSEEATKNLDESGIVRIGSYVKGGDILVGKVTPKGEAQPTPEEKLLRAIFGDKAGDVRDTSVRLPRSAEGVVTDVVVFNREGVERDQRSKEIEQEQLRQYKQDYHDELKIIHRNLLEVTKFLIGCKLQQDIVSEYEETLASQGDKITQELLESIVFAKENQDNSSMTAWESVQIKNEESNEKLQVILESLTSQRALLKNVFEDKCEKVAKGDDLKPGVIRTIKVYVATKRKLSVGDKMAGRHGNKGVVSKIQLLANMPYMEDGTPIDIVLNPLGVPSRMNVGQVLETHLGWAARELGQQLQKFVQDNHPVNQIKKFMKDIYSSPQMDDYLKQMSDQDFVEFAKKYFKGVHMATPVFDGAHEEDIHRMLDLAGLPRSGQTRLYDGLTGEPFDQKVTVGCAYILKLHHLVDEKIHARSIGPYSLITQQPLGGKAQFGGQRFGEMEVWALEAYGAAHTLKELLTVKSDDVQGRNKTYEAIVKGRHHVETGLPEAFKVLSSELKSLSLNVELIDEEEMEPSLED